MTFDAGSIDSRLTLDRSPFTRELRAAVLDAERVSNSTYRPRLELDTSRFRSELDRAKADLDRFGSQSGNLKIRLDADKARYDLKSLKLQLDELTLHPHVIKIRTDIDEASLKRLEETLRRIKLLQDRRPNPGPGGGGGGSSNSKDNNLPGLLGIALMLAPALVPIAAGLGAIAASAAGLGVTGVLAFKGINAEMKAGTDLGRQYKAGLDTVKLGISNTERIAAGGVLSGFQSGVAKLNQELPQFNQYVGRASTQLGDIASHLVGGLIGGFRNFGTVLDQGGGYLDHLASRFEAWATGPGGAKFAQTLSDDLAAVIPLLGQLGTLLAHIAGAANPVGVVLVHGFTALAQAINSLPLPVLTALISALVTLKSLSTAKSLIGLLGGLGGGAGLLGRAAPFLAGGAALAGIGIGTQILPSVLPGSFKNAYYGQNPGSFGASVYAGAQGVKDLFSGDPGGVSRDMAKAQAAQAAIRGAQGSSLSALATLITTENQQFSQKMALLGDPRVSQKQLQSYNKQNPDNPIYTQPNAPGQPSSTTPDKQFNVAAHAQALAYYNKQLAAVQTGLQSVTNANGQFTQRLGGATAAVLAQATKVTDAQAAYANYDKTLANDQKTQKSWIDAGKGLTVTLDGNKYSLGAYQTALQQANGDQAKAVGILEGHRAAYDADTEALSRSADAQARLAAAYGQATGQATVNADATQKVRAAMGLTVDQVDQYRQILGITLTDLSSGAVSADAFATAVGRVHGDVMDANAATQGWIGALLQFNQSAKTAADRGALIGAYLKAAQGDALGFASTMVGAAQANQQFVTDLANVKDGVINLKNGTIDYHNAAAAPLLNDLSNLQTAAMNAAAAVYQHEVATKNNKRAADDAYTTYQTNTRGALIDEATKLLGSASAARKLADEYFPLSNAKDIKKNIEMLGSDHAEAVMSGILEDLDKLAGLSHTQLYVDLHVNAPGQVTIPIVYTGGAPGSGSHSGIHIGGASAAGNIYKFAAGGEYHVPQIALPKGAFRMWAEPETQGEAYIPLAGDWRRPRAKQLIQQVANQFGGSAFFASGGEHGGYTGVDYGGHTNKNGKTTNPKGSGSSSTASTAQSKAAAARLTLLQGLLTGVDSALSSLSGQIFPVSALSQALGGLATAMQKVHNAGVGSQRMVNALKRDEDQLRTNLSLRDQYQKSLDSARSTLSSDVSARTQYGQTVADSFRGGFTATSGNGYAYGIKASLDAAVETTQRFAAARKKAEALGLDPQLIQMYEQAGPEGLKNLEAIARQGKSYVTSLNKDEAALTSSSRALGNTAASDKYDKQVRADQAKVAHYTQLVHDENVKIRREMTDIRRIVDAMERDLRSAITAQKKK